MKLEDVESNLHCFGYGVSCLSHICEMLQVKRQNITLWRKQGYIPMLHQYKIAELTEGKLMPDQEDPRIIRNKGASQ